MQTEQTDAASNPSPEFANTSPAPPRRHALGWILALTLVWLGLAPAASAQGLGAIREIFTDLTGSSLQNLTNNSNYPDHPASSELMTNYFEGPYNYGDHYGDRYRALLIPPLSGTYVFWVQGQNAAALSLSTKVHLTAPRLPSAWRPPSIANTMPIRASSRPASSSRRGAAII